MSTIIPKVYVKTAHSNYVIDQEAGTYIRTRREAEANDLSQWGHTDGEAREYLKIVSPLQPGERLVIVEPNGHWLTSTPILEVTTAAAV